MAFRFGHALWKKGDGAVIDGLGPDGISSMVRRLSGQAIRLQSGFLYHYAFAMMIGLIAFASWYIFGLGINLMTDDWPISLVTFLPLVGCFLFF